MGVSSKTRTPSSLRPGALRIKTAARSPPYSPPMSGRLLRNTSVYAAGELLGRLAVFAMVPVYTARLAPEELATWGLGAMVVQALTVAYGLGVQAALPQLQYPQLDDEAALRRLNGSVALALLLWAPALHLLLEATAPSLLARFLPGLPWAPYGRLASLTAAVGVTAIVPIARWTTRERPGPFALTSLAKSLVEVGATLGLLLGTSMGVLALFLGRFVAHGVLALPLLAATLRSVTLRLRPRLLLPVLAFALPLVPDLLATWALTMADRVVLSRVSTEHELGLYTAAYWFPLALGLLAVNANRAWAPTFHKAAVRGERGDPQTATVFILALAWVGGAVVALAPHVVARLFGAAYAEAAPMASALGVLGVFLGLWQVGVAGLYASTRRLAIPLATGIAAAVGLALDLWAVPRFGGLGAAWATVAAYGLLALLVWSLGRGGLQPAVAWGRLLSGVAWLALLAGVAVALDSLASDLAAVAAGLLLFLPEARGREASP